MDEMNKFGVGDTVYFGDPELSYMVTWVCPHYSNWVYDIKGFGYAGHTWVDESELSKYTLKERVKRLEERIGLGL